MLRTVGVYISLLACSDDPGGDKSGCLSLTCTTGAQHRTLKERPILSGYRWQFQEICTDVLSIFLPFFTFYAVRPSTMCPSS